MDAVERAMNEKLGEIRGLDGEVGNPSFVVTAVRDAPKAEARFDDRLCREQIDREVEYDQDPVEDPGGSSS